MKLPKIKKLDAKGLSHHVLVAILVVTGIAGFGAWRVFSSNAQTPTAKPSGGTSTSSVFTVKSSDLYGDGSGAVATGTTGKGKSAVSYIEFAKGSKAWIVNTTTSADALKNWTVANQGKMAKICVNAMSVGTSSSLGFNSNNLQAGADSDGNPYSMTTQFYQLTSSSSYAKYCSPAYKLTMVTVPSGRVTININMRTAETSPAGDVLATSGPLRISGVTFELQ